MILFSWNWMTGSVTVLGVCVVLVILIGSYRYLTKKVGPNEALIIFGQKGTRIVVGGAAFVNPVTEQFRQFSLELVSFDVAPTNALYTAQGIAVQVEAVAQLKVRTNNLECIRLAAEQFLSKTGEECEQIMRQVLEGHLRNVVGGLTVDDLVVRTAKVAEQMRASVSPDLEQMGLGVVSLTLKNVCVSTDALATLGKRGEREEQQRQQLAAHVQVHAARSPDVMVKEMSLSNPFQQAEIMPTNQPSSQKRKRMPRQEKGALVSSPREQGSGQQENSL
jgi:flotillin